MLKIIKSKSDELLFSEVSKRLEVGLKSGLTSGKLLLFTPEQSSFSTELEIYKTMGGFVAANVEITSFSKFSEKICSENLPREKFKGFADETTKTVCLFTAAKDGNNNRLKQAEAFIKEFQNSGVTPDEILDAENIPQEIRKKAEICKKYISLIELAHIDRPDATRKAAEIISENPHLIKQNKAFFFGFDGFTGAQLKLIETFAKNAGESTFAFFCTEKNNELIDFLISDLELKFKTTAEIKNVDGINKPEKISVVCENAYSEADFCAKEIRRLITEQDFKQSEIAVIPLEKTSLFALKDSFEKYDITTFADLPGSLSEKPIVRFILNFVGAALELSGNEYDKPTMFITFLKSEFLRIPREVTVSGEKIYDENTTPTKKLSPIFAAEFADLITENLLTVGDLFSSFEECPIQELRRFEPLRAYLVNLIDVFSVLCRKKDGAEITSIFADYVLNKLDIYRSIVGVAKENTLHSSFEKGFNLDKKKVDEYRDIWEKMIDIFESMYYTFADIPNKKPMKLKDFNALITLTFERVKLAKVPETLDFLTVADLKRSRFSNLRVIFITDAVEGKLPDFSDFKAAKSDLETLSKAMKNPDICEKNERKILRARYRAERIMSVASEKTYIIAPKKNVSGEILTPSRLFSLENSIDFDEPYPIITKKSSKMFPEEHINKTENVNVFPEEHLDPKNQPYLKYLKERTFTPSSLERLFSCQMRFLLNDVLKFKEKKDGKVDLNIFYGDIIHQLLSGKTTESYLSWRYPFGGNRLKTIAKNYELHYEFIKEDFKTAFNASSFVPLLKEKSLQFNFGNIKIKGRPDYADIVDNEDEKFVRIIDYKSKEKNPNLENMTKHALQLFIYLVGLAQELDAIPASALVFPIKKVNAKIVEEQPFDLKISDFSDEEAQNNRILEKRKIHGFYITDSKISTEEIKRLQEIKAECLKNGKISKESYAPFANRKNNKKKFSIAEFEALKQQCINDINLFLDNVSNLELNMTINPKNCDKCEYKNTLCRGGNGINDFTESGN